MLKYRLFFGVLMTVFFTGVVILDGWLDGSVTASPADDSAVQGTILCVLVGLLIIPAQLEFSKLAAAKNLNMFKPVSIAASILLASSRYWLQITQTRPEVYLLLLFAFSLLAVLAYQYACYGSLAVIANCGANYFSIVYLGLLGGFVPAVRIDFGLWPLLMFVFVVKSADIGAYVGGSLFGRHKFSPKTSPGKTWEGMGAAVVVAVIVAVAFATSCDIMVWWSAAIFGFCFAFIGQMGDLTESMMKRDSQQKDSSSSVPGFGGVLDIIDSLLVAAPFAYLYFMLATVD